MAQTATVLLKESIDLQISCIVTLVPFFATFTLSLSPLNMCVIR